MVTHTYTYIKIAFLEKAVYIKITQNKNCFGFTCKKGSYCVALDNYTKGSLNIRMSVEHLELMQNGAVFSFVELSYLFPLLRLTSSTKCPQYWSTIIVIPPPHKCPDRCLTVGALVANLCPNPTTSLRNLKTRKVAGT
jgi:hypothetical protein